MDGHSFCHYSQNYAQKIGAGGREMRRQQYLNDWHVVKTQENRFLRIFESQQWVEE
jgi:hypothetical protein